MSFSVFAGTSALRLISGSSGFHSISRMASLYRSVASMASDVPFSSSRTPVIIGSVSSRPAATATCATAAANAAASTVPALDGISGRVG